MPNDQANLEEWARRAHQAQAAAAQAYARLLDLAETRDSGQFRRVKHLRRRDIPVRPLRAANR